MGQKWRIVLGFLARLKLLNALYLRPYQAGNEVGASSFLARNELSMLFPYASFPAGNELVLKLAKNMASGVWLGTPK